jgi:hypothetical protein
MKLYKMRYYYSLQPWYMRDGIFKLVRKTEHYISYFGRDCEWEDIRTGVSVNNWDSVMEELSTEDTKVILRDLNLNKIGID